MIKLFTSKQCGHCAAAKAELKAKGINFKEISVDNKSGWDESERLGIQAVPAIVKDGKICNNINNCIK